MNNTPIGRVEFGPIDVTKQVTLPVINNIGTAYRLYVDKHNIMKLQRCYDGHTWKDVPTVYEKDTTSQTIYAN